MLHIRAIANGKLKEAVVKYDIINFKPDNSLLDVRYDADGNGALSFDIAADGGPETDAIKAAFSPDALGRQRVVIVRNMKSFYYLSLAANIGDTTITVRGGKHFFIFQYLWVLA